MHWELSMCTALSLSDLPPLYWQTLVEDEIETKTFFYTSPLTIKA